MSAIFFFSKCSEKFVNSKFTHQIITDAGVVYEGDERLFHFLGHSFRVYVRDIQKKTSHVTRQFSVIPSISAMRCN